LAGRSKKRRLPFQHPSQPGQPQQESTTPQAPGYVNPPVNHPGASETTATQPVASASRATTAVAPTPPQQKLTPAEARFLAEQRYFVQDLVRIGLVTAVISITFVVLYFFIG
jgi:hypothetical protein